MSSILNFPLHVHTAGSSARLLPIKRARVGGYPTLKKTPVIGHRSVRERNLPLWWRLLPAASFWGLYLYSDSSGPANEQSVEAAGSYQEGESRYLWIESKINRARNNELHNLKEPDMNSVMTEVWNHSKQTGEELLTLLAIAETVQPGSRVSVFMPNHIAKKARMGIIATKQSIKRLVMCEEIHIESDQKLITASIRKYKLNGYHDTKRRTKSLIAEVDQLVLEQTGNALNVQTFNAYRLAYKQRYSVDPVRNKTVNCQIKNFVGRLGKESPEVSAFYLKHNSKFYVSNCHSVGLMLRDAEKLHTEWLSGRLITDSEARSADRKQGNFNAANEVIRRRAERAAH